MNQSILNDLSNLTNVPQKDLERFVSKLELCICHDIFSSIDCKSVEIDLAIGKLYIKLDDDIENVLYKFIPSKSLENKIISTLVDKKDPLVCEIEKSLVQKIKNSYKELF